MTFFHKNKKVFFFLFFIFGIIFILFYFSLQKKTYSPSLAFPKEKHLLTSFSCVFHSKESSSNSTNSNIKLDPNSNSNTSKNTLYVSGILKGSPSLIQDGVEYQCLFNQLVIKNSNKQLLLHFQRGSDQTYLYQIDPSFSADTREQIFNSFKINTNNSSSLNDDSLLQQSFFIHFNKLGVLESIRLPIALKNAIHQGLLGKRFSFLIKEILQSSSSLPPLFSSNSSGSSHKKLKNWMTKGFFFEPIRMSHQITEKKDGNIVIKSKSLPFDKKQLLKIPGGFIRFSNKVFLENAWQAEWAYDTHLQQLDNLKLILHWKIKEKLLNQLLIDDYQIQLSFQNHEKEEK